MLLQQSIHSRMIFAALFLLGSGFLSAQRRGPAPRSGAAQRIQEHSYGFPETKTKIEYAVFVSSKVKKSNKSPLVIALHGAGVSPDQMLSFVLLGQSMGGAGALHIGVKYRETWAAIAATAPAAASLSPSSLETVRDLPVILVHGDADQSVAVAQTRRWVEKLRELNMTYEYYEIAGGSHRDAIIAGASNVFAFFDKHPKR